LLIVLMFNQLIVKKRRTRKDHSSSSLHSLQETDNKMRILQQKIMRNLQEMIRLLAKDRFNQELTSKWSKRPKNPSKK
jgi:hypothetical protein